jgi:hypothetical protein
MPKETISAMNQRTACRILLICPLALFALSIITTNLQGPFYFGRNSDPEYAFLLNGLNIATLQAPGLDGHPGTTLEVIEGLIILAKWAVGNCLFGPWESLHDAVLLRPEDYLHTISLVLNLLLSAVIYLAARRIYKLTESLLVALVFQISFGMFMNPLYAQARVSSEPLLAFAVVLLAFPLAPLVFDRDGKLSETEGRLALATGLALAFGIVTKMTFAPLLAVCLLFRRRSSLLACLAWCFAGAFALLFPIWTHLPKMYVWFASLLVHKERYGGGPVGFPSMDTLVSQGVSILRYEPMLVLLLACYGATYVAIRKGWVRTPNGEADRVGRLLLVGTIVIVVQVAITLKHFAMHYLLPVMVFTMLTNAALIFLFRQAEPGKISRLLYAASVLLLLLGMWHSYRWLAIWKTASNQYRADVSTLLNRRSQMKDCKVIPYYRSSSREFALSFGEDWTGSAYGRELAEIYPQAIHYDIWAHQFYSMKMEDRRAQIRRDLAAGACYLMQGTPPSKEDLDQLSGFTLTEVIVAGDEGLYRLGLGTITVIITEAALPANATAVDARRFSSGNVVADNSAFGKGIGAIVSPVYPAHVEYEIPLQKAGRYELRIRCASLEARPVAVLINGASATRNGCSEPTGGYDPAHQQWQVAGQYGFIAGPNAIRLESKGPFPVINQLGLVPVAP